jgi:hypothetical protein
MPRRKKSESVSEPPATTELLPRIESTRTTHKIGDRQRVEIVRHQPHGETTVIIKVTECYPPMPSKEVLVYLPKSAAKALRQVLAENLW